VTALPDVAESILDAMHGLSERCRLTLAAMHAKTEAHHFRTLEVREGHCRLVDAHWSVTYTVNAFFCKSQLETVTVPARRTDQVKKTLSSRAKTSKTSKGGETQHHLDMQ